MTGGENLTSLAYKCGFYDSAHLATEFHHFSGLSPSSYLSKNRDLRNISNKDKMAELLQTGESPEKRTPYNKDAE
jgi:AraC-like DNA-binding protein